MAGTVSRRALLGGAALGLGGLGSLAAGRAVTASAGDLTRPFLLTSPSMRRFATGMPTLPTLTGPTLDLAAHGATHLFHPDFDPVPSFGYGPTTYLGPTIEAQAGETTSLISRNKLGAHPFAGDIDPTVHGASRTDGTAPRTVLHLHGGVTPPESDGNAEATILPGGSVRHQYPGRQEAATLWYHDHAMGITRLNVYAGLAGLYLLRDRWDTGRTDNPLGLPAGRHEVPLVLQEKIFTADGRQSIRSTNLVPKGSWEGGAVGDVGLVNGAVWPVLEVDRGLYRFRVLNAGSFSVWNLHFSNRMTFWVIGTDGGLVNAPVPTRNLRIASGERVDILVDFSGLRSGESVELLNDEVPPLQALFIGEVAMPLFCRFTATATRGHRGPVPERLRGGPGLPPRLPDVAELPRPERIRTVSVNQWSDWRIPPAMMNLNNLRYADPGIEMPRQGSVEQWDIVNTTRDPHPIHLHLVHFRIIGRQPFDPVQQRYRYPRPSLGTRWAPTADKDVTGPMAPPEPWERGLKDVVRADGRHVTRVLVRWPTADELGFDPDASFDAPDPMAGMDHSTDPETAGTPQPLRGTSADQPLRGYMWHCHILDHEDHEMMLRFRTPER